MEDWVRCTTGVGKKRSRGEIHFLGGGILAVAAGVGGKMGGKVSTLGQAKADRGNFGYERGRKMIGISGVEKNQCPFLSQGV